MVAKFSHQGKLIWDQTFEMWSAYKPFYVKKFISIAKEVIDLEIKALQKLKKAVVMAAIMA